MPREITVQLIADAAKFKEGMASALPPMAAVGAAAVAAAVGIAAVSLKMAGDFQSATDTLITGAGESAKNIEMVRQGILKLAPAVGVGPEQLVKALYNIESAGFHGAEGLKVLQAAAEGAKVGNAEMATVADAVTSAMNAYGLSAHDAVSVTNMLVATVAAGKMHMQDLAGSLGAVVPAAAAAHVNLREVLAAIATMTAMGTPAADAATYLKQTILQLSNPSAKAALEMKALGLSSIEVSKNLGRNGLSGTLDILTSAIEKKMGPSGIVLIENLKSVAKNTTAFQKVLADLPPTQQTYVAALANMVGGTKSMQAALELSGSHMAVFQGNIDSISNAGDKMTGHVQGWAVVQASFNQKMDQLKAGVEVAAIAIGMKLLPIATRFAAWLMDTAVPWIQNAIKVMGTWKDLWNTLGNIIAVVSAVLRVSVPVAIAIVKKELDIIIPVLRTLYTIFTDIVTAIQAVIRWFGNMVSVISKSPVGSILGGIGGAAHTLHIPGFDAGGVVPGAYGSPQLVMARGGETFGGFPPSGGRGGLTINLFATVADGPALDKFTNDIALRLGYATGL